MYVTTCYTHMNSIVNIVQVFIVEDRIGHQFDVLWALQEECCWIDKNCNEGIDSQNRAIF